MKSLVNVGEEVITKLLKGVDDWGTNKAVKLPKEDAAAYRQYGRDYHAKHGSMKGHMKVNYGNEEFSLKTNKPNPDGSPNLKVRPKTVKTRQDEVRKAREDSTTTRIQQAQDQRGRPQEETDEILTHVKRGNKAQATSNYFANKKIKDKNKKVTRGHIKALGNDGLDVPENVKRENARYNYRTQNKEDAPEVNIRMAGAPNNVEEYLAQYGLNKEFPQLNLSKLPLHIREKILKAANAEEIDDILTTYEESLSAKPRRRRKRK